LVSVFALASGSFSAETSELNFCGLQETEFFRVPRTRFLPSYGFVRDARVGIRGARLDSRVIYRSHAYKIETPTSGESSGPMMGHWWSILQKAACGCRAATINGCGKWQRLCQRISLQSSRSETSQVSRNSSGCKFACLWLDQRVKV